MARSDTSGVLATPSPSVGLSPSPGCSLRLNASNLGRYLGGVCSGLSWAIYLNRVGVHADPPTVFLYIFLPEMRNRTLEEIDELFQERVPTRQFAKYHCVSSERAREQVMRNIGVEEEDLHGEEKLRRTDVKDEIGVEHRESTVVAN